MKLQPASEHPHGLPDRDFDALFTTDKPIIFAFHGYPWLIHRLTYRRNGHGNLHVRGYKEEGTTSTPFDMCVMNELDRFHLVGDVIDRVPGLGCAGGLRQAGDPRQADRAQALHLPAWRRHARDHGLVVGPDEGCRSRELDGGRQRLTREAAVNTFVIRHGETAWSLSGQHTGTTDIPLTENGRRLAERLRPVLAEEVFALVLVQPDAAGLGDLRAGGARPPGRDRPRPGGVELRPSMRG